MFIYRAIFKLSSIQKHFRFHLYHRPMLLPLIFLVLLPPLSAATCRPDEKSALLAFKNSFSNPPPSWDPVYDCCEWNGVQCDDMTNEVVSLDFSSVNFKGTIPSNIANLKHLQYLRLHKMPNLTGHIPQAIQELPYLTELVISWTNISGPIPDVFKNLKNLNYLDLSYNRLSGSIPPSLATLPALYAIDLSRNQLSGPIPESFGNLKAEYSTLGLSHNFLSGEIPSSLANVNFSVLDISRNSLSGDASVFFGKGKITRSIDISRNNFEFDFSKVIFMDSLVALDISHNKVYGHIPQQIVEVFLKGSVNVSYNRLCGQIPNGWNSKYRPQNWDVSSFFHNRCLCGSPLQPCN